MRGFPWHRMCDHSRASKYDSFNTPKENIILDSREVVGSPVSGFLSRAAAAPRCSAASPGRPVAEPGPTGNWWISQQCSCTWTTQLELPPETHKHDCATEADSSTDHVRIPLGCSIWRNVVVVVRRNVHWVIQHCKWITAFCRGSCCDCAATTKFLMHSTDFAPLKACEHFQLYKSHLYSQTTQLQLKGRKLAAHWSLVCNHHSDSLWHHTQTVRSCLISFSFSVLKNRRNTSA